MKKITAQFSKEALDEMEKIGIELDDSHDYSKDELEELYIKITEDFPYEFDENGKPLRLGRIFEEIVDALLEMGAAT